MIFYGFFLKAKGFFPKVYGILQSDTPLFSIFIICSESSIDAQLGLFTGALDCRSSL